ncbi:MAG: cytidine deaminase [Deltaproteobacteria bacterium]|nr:cytidine deaminase [Deltaproteobacteria bacterium]
MDEATFQRMLDAARAAQANAYAPYSGFRVGAAVLGGSGAVFGGCNVENASYPVSTCAERGAISAAVAAGEKAIVAVLIVGTAADPVPPCGFCRQALSEFGASMQVVLVGEGGVVKERSLADLLPEAFGPSFFAPRRG